MRGFLRRHGGSLGLAAHPVWSRAELSDPIESWRSPRHRSHPQRLHHSEVEVVSSDDRSLGASDDVLRVSWLAGHRNGSPGRMSREPSLPVVAVDAVMNPTRDTEAEQVGPIAEARSVVGSEPLDDFARVS
jgi:hypothetical protein